MRYFVLAGLLICMVSAAAVAAEQTQGKLSDPASQTVVFEETGGTGVEDVAAGEGKPQAPNDGGVDDAGTMPSYESYDENTGLPDNVPSDTYGQFD